MTKDTVARLARMLEGERGARLLAEEERDELERVARQRRQAIAELTPFRNALERIVAEWRSGVATPSARRARLSQAIDDASKLVPVPDSGGYDRITAGLEKVERPAPFCPPCDGTGIHEDDDGRRFQCGACQGTGKVPS